LKGKNVEKRQGANYTKVDAVDQLKGKVVALYFSAHWCPPCRAFTPILRDFYEQLDGQPFEIVFVSFDRSESDLKQYVAEAHGNWIVIPFGDPEIRELTNKYSVEGIPALIVIKSNGDVITKSARSDIQAASKGPQELLNDWKKLAGI